MSGSKKTSKTKAKQKRQDTSESESESQSSSPPKKKAAISKDSTITITKNSNSNKHATASNISPASILMAKTKFNALDQGSFTIFALVSPARGGSNIKPTWHRSFNIDLTEDGTESWLDWLSKVKAPDSDLPKDYIFSLIDYRAYLAFNGTERREEMDQDFQKLSKRIDSGNFPYIHSKDKRQLEDFLLERYNVINFKMTAKKLSIKEFINNKTPDLPYFPYHYLFIIQKVPFPRKEKINVVRLTPSSYVKQNRSSQWNSLSKSTFTALTNSNVIRNLENLSCDFHSWREKSIKFVFDNYSDIKEREQHLDSFSNLQSMFASNDWLILNGPDAKGNPETNSLWLDDLADFLGDKKNAEANDDKPNTTTILDQKKQAVGRIYGEVEGKRRFIGVGFMLSNKYLMTCFHNLYKHEKKKELITDHNLKFVFSMLNTSNDIISEFININSGTNDLNQSLENLCSAYKNLHLNVPRLLLKQDSSLTYSWNEDTPNSVSEIEEENLKTKLEGLKLSLLLNSSPSKNYNCGPRAIAQYILDDFLPSSIDLEKYARALRFKIIQKMIEIDALNYTKTENVAEKCQKYYRRASNESKFGVIEFDTAANLLKVRIHLHRPDKLIQLPESSSLEPADSFPVINIAHFADHWIYCFSKDRNDLERTNIKTRLNQIVEDYDRYVKISFIGHSSTAPLAKNFQISFSLPKKSVFHSKTVRIDDDNNNKINDNDQGNNFTKSNNNTDNDTTEATRPGPSTASSKLATTPPTASESANTTSSAANISLKSPNDSTRRIIATQSLTNPTLITPPAKAGTNQEAASPSVAPSHTPTIDTSSSNPTQPNSSTPRTLSILHHGSATPVIATVHQMINDSASVASSEPLEITKNSSNETNVDNTFTTATSINENYDNQNSVNRQNLRQIASSAKIGIDKSGLDPNSRVKWYNMSKVSSDFKSFTAPDGKEFAIEPTPPDGDCIIYAIVLASLFFLDQQNDTSVQNVELNSTTIDNYVINLRKNIANTMRDNFDSYSDSIVHLLDGTASDEEIKADKLKQIDDYKKRYTYKGSICDLAVDVVTKTPFLGSNKYFGIRIHSERDHHYDSADEYRHHKPAESEAFTIDLLLLLWDHYELLIPIDVYPSYERFMSRICNEKNNGITINKNDSEQEHYDGDDVDDSMEKIIDADSEIVTIPFSLSNIIYPQDHSNRSGIGFDVAIILLDDQRLRSLFTKDNTIHLFENTVEDSVRFLDSHDVADSRIPKILLINQNLLVSGITKGGSLFAPRSWEISYCLPTKKGDSGSPGVFPDGRLVCMHRAGGTAYYRKDNTPERLFNVGLRIDLFLRDAFDLYINRYPLAYYRNFKNLRPLPTIVEAMLADLNAFYGSDHRRTCTS